MKKLLAFPVILATFVLLGFFVWRNISSPANSRDTQTRDFIITKGQSLTSVAINLEKNGFIKNSLVFRAYSQITGRPKIVQPGDYKLSPSLSLHQIILTFEKGPEQFWITIPEGLRREEISDRVVSSLELDQTEARRFADEFILASKGQEGYLFPDTYLLGKEDSAEKLVSKMKGIFNTKVTAKMKEDVKKNRLSLEETIVLASIIERETKTEGERSVVAGILFNRLNHGIALQVDATLQYISGTENCYQGSRIKLDCKWWGVPTVGDRQAVSKYNTYQNRGLPPFPIGNPGLSSIMSAIYPQDSDYLYYIHGKDGKIHYAKTGEEHLQNIDNYLR